MHARRLSYTCIFSKSVDEAVANLSRILLAGDNGFDEGSSFWAQLIDDILSDGCDQEELNFHGTSFSKEWWVDTLSQVRGRLGDA